MWAGRELRSSGTCFGRAVGETEVAVFRRVRQTVLAEFDKLSAGEKPYPLFKRLVWLINCERKCNLDLPNAAVQKLFEHFSSPPATSRAYKAIFEQLYELCRLTVEFAEYERHMTFKLRCVEQAIAFAQQPVQPSAGLDDDDGDGGDDDDYDAGEEEGEEENEEEEEDDD